MKFKGAIFDMDGTLIDSMGFWKTAPGDYIRSLGKEPDADLGDRFLTLGLSSIYDDVCERYEIDLPIEEISRGIIEIMDRTATIVDVEGAYSKQSKKMIMVSFNIREYSDLMAIINREDPKAFMTISKVHENRGEGWTHEKT